jgi:hypothetical protein
MITDNNVLRIIERTDLDGKEKMLLIYLLSKEPPPERARDDTYTIVGMAKVGPEQVSDDLGKGFHRSAFKDLTRNLKRRGFLDVKGEKGGPANRYRVKFPSKKKKEDGQNQKTEEQS